LLTAVVLWRRYAPDPARSATPTAPAPEGRPHALRAGQAASRAYSC